MAITRKQALAFFKAVLAAKNVQAVCEGILGADEVPKLEDFQSRDPGTLDKCEAFTAHMLRCIKLIDQELHGRERQTEIDFEKSRSKKKVSGLKSPAKDKSKAKTAPKLVKGAAKKKNTGSKK